VAACWWREDSFSWNELVGPNVNPNTVLQEKFGEDPVKPYLVSEYFKKENRSREDLSESEPNSESKSS